METRRTTIALGLLAVVAVIGCGSTPPSATASLGRPVVQIDEGWSEVDGRWTFTGRVDPQGGPADVVFEIGPGPSTARRFDTQLTVAEGVASERSLSVTTQEIPDIAEVCVRFSATTSAGRSSSQPLCFPNVVPTIVPAAPTVQIDRDWTLTDGEYAFSARVDPEGAPVSVVLEIGRGPASAPEFEIQIPAAQNLSEAATLTRTTRDLPDAEEVCVRFTATNALGTASSEALCFDPDSPPGAP
jgi:hypothetical protein